MNGLAVSGEVVSASTALAGLILVYIGTLVGGYSAFQPQEQRTVRARYVARAWIAFVGMALALATAALGVVGKWIANLCIANLAVVFLLTALAWGGLTAILTIREMK